LETIGEGGFAIVNKARKEKDSLLLAIKVPRVPYRDFIKELAVWLHLNNRSISILSNMIYTRLTTKNSAYAFVELAYYVFQLFLFEASKLLRNKYPEIAIQRRNAWTLHVEGFREISLNEKEVAKLKEDVRKLVVTAVVSSFR
jgi:hypothetical protein